ncbi:MAG: hypothetical protein KJZ80_11385 [Hyphomicrobiaceae bacterium]|nr:hypothetical protein [Hyphomicrobiaceae bacterium]
MSDQQHWVRPKSWPVFGIGHNGGPPLDDDEPPGKLLFVRHCWKKAHEEAWRTPSRDIVLFRMRRAEAAGLTYREYILELLDTGRYPQAGDPRPSKREENHE